jgi:hypothetical protein
LELLYNTNRPIGSGRGFRLTALLPDAGVEVQILPGCSAAVFHRLSTKRCSPHNDPARQLIESDHKVGG